MRILRDVTGRADLSRLPGRTRQCRVCGATVRDGQAHTALVPVPHQTLEALVVREDLE